MKKILLGLMWLGSTAVLAADQQPSEGCLPQGEGCEECCPAGSVRVVFCFKGEGSGTKAPTAKVAKVEKAVKKGESGKTPAVVVAKAEK